MFFTTFSSVFSLPVDLTVMVIKFSFSEKATKIYLVNVKTIRRMAQIFVAFSEKLNFT